MLNKFDDVWNVFVIISRNGVVGYKDWETFAPIARKNISISLAISFQLDVLFLS